MKYLDIYAKEYNLYHDAYGKILEYIRWEWENEEFIQMREVLYASVIENNGGIDSDTLSILANIRIAQYCFFDAFDNSTFLHIGIDKQWLKSLKSNEISFYKIITKSQDELILEDEMTKSKKIIQWIITEKSNDLWLYSPWDYIIARLVNFDTELFLFCTLYKFKKEDLFTKFLKESLIELQEQQINLDGLISEMMINTLKNEMNYFYGTVKSLNKKSKLFKKIDTFLHSKLPLSKYKKSIALLDQTLYSQWKEFVEKVYPLLDYQDKHHLWLLLTKYLQEETGGDFISIQVNILMMQKLYQWEVERIKKENGIIDNNDLFHKLFIDKQPDNNYIQLYKILKDTIINGTDLENLLWDNYDKFQELFGENAK